MVSTDVRSGMIFCHDCIDMTTTAPLLDKGLPENIQFNGRRIFLQYCVQLQISAFD
jgi:hypothetical protein